MLPKKRRIKRELFPSIITAGKRYNSPHFQLYVLKGSINKDNFETKFSFSVSKKVCPKAIERNKLRRRGYSVIKNLSNSVSKDYLCFFIYKKGALSVKYEVLEKEIKELLSSSSVIT